MSFKFRLSKQSTTLNTKNYSNEFEVIDLEGFKTTTELLEEIVLSAKFDVENKDKLIASQVQSNQIKWKQASEELNKGVIATYSNLTHDDINGRLGFKVTFTKGNISKEHTINIGDLQAISGFISINDKLIEIAATATFDYNGKENIFASQAQISNIVWKEANDVLNTGIIAAFENIKSDDINGRLGFVVIFSKGSTSYRLPIQPNENQSIKGFKLKTDADLIEDIANNATFKPANKNKIATDVTLENANIEIVWDQEQLIQGAKITYSNIV